MWAIYALLGAFTAALVSIFAKLGLSSIDSTLAATVRGVVMSILMLGAAFSLGKFKGFTFEAFTGREWMFIFLAGVAGALSWLFSFFAIKAGTASGAVALDKLSVVMVVALAALFLGETLTWKAGLGALLMTAGALLIAFK